jgi:5,10-methylene-tetrahydrofolate dehydrogenase/methenyl tetrahydrofolate cyclohydrolase
MQRSTARAYVARSKFANTPNRTPCVALPALTMSGMYGVKDGVPAGVPSYANLSLAGKTVVVVGGTSGVGQAVALACARKGANVTVVGRTFKVRRARVVSAAAAVPPRSSGRLLYARSSLLFLPSFVFCAFCLLLSLHAAWE